MTIKMRLDTDGLRALIKDNPTLELEIGKAVMDNIRADEIKGRVEGQIREVLKGMVENKGYWSTPNWVIKDAGFRQAVDKAVGEALNLTIDEHIKAKVQDLVGSALRFERELLTQDVKRMLQELVTPELAKEILREKILL